VTTFVFSFSVKQKVIKIANLLDCTLFTLCSLFEITICDLKKNPFAVPICHRKLKVAICDL